MFIENGLKIKAIFCVALSEFAQKSSARLQQKLAAGEAAWHNGDRIMFSTH